MLGASAEVARQAAGANAGEMLTLPLLAESRAITVRRAACGYQTRSYWQIFAQPPQPPAESFRFFLWERKFPEAFFDLEVYH